MRTFPHAASIAQPIPLPSGVLAQGPNGQAPLPNTSTTFRTDNLQPSSERRTAKGSGAHRVAGGPKAPSPGAWESLSMRRRDRSSMRALSSSLGGSRTVTAATTLPSSRLRGSDWKVATLQPSNRPRDDQPSEPRRSDQRSQLRHARRTANPPQGVARWSTPDRPPAPLWPPVTVSWDRRQIAAQAVLALNSFYCLAGIGLPLPR